MKKIKVFALIILVVFISSCSDSSSKSQQSEQKNSPAASSAVSTGDVGVTIYYVEIRSSGLRPEVVEISKGDRVTWTNYDSADHTITGPTFPMPTSTSPKTSGRLQPGESWTKQFDITGFYGYSDIYNDNLKGKVVVK